MYELCELQTLIRETAKFLCGEIHSQVRAIKVNLDQDKKIIHFWFYFDGEVPEEEHFFDMLIDTIIKNSNSESISSYTIKKYIMRCDFPQAMPEDGYYVYLRDETIFQNNLVQPVLIAPEIYINKEVIISGYQIILAGIYALLGNVRPNLRGVKWDLNEIKNTVYLWFYFDNELSDEDKKIAKIISDRVISLLSCHCNLELKIERLNFPQKVPYMGFFIYARNERLSEELLNDENSGSFSKYNKKREWCDFNNNQIIHHFDATSSPSDILYSLRIASLKRIGSNWRAISYLHDPFQRKIYLRFYFDGKISEDDSYRVDEIVKIITPVCSYNIEAHIERIDFPQKIPIFLGGVLFFARREDRPKPEEKRPIIPSQKEKKNVRSLKGRLQFNTDKIKPSVRHEILAAKMAWQQIIHHFTAVRPNCSKRRKGIKENPNLRAIRVFKNRIARTFYHLFIFHGEPTKEDYEAAERYLQSERHCYASSIVQLGYLARYDYPDTIPPIGKLIYLRKGEEEPDENSNVELAIRFFQAVSAALVRNIDPHLRAVKADVDEMKKHFYFWFYFDGELSQHDKLVAEKITQCSSQWEGFSCITEVERYDYPAKIPTRGIYIYYRYEVGL